MHIHFFSHYFAPEGNAPASRTYEHCVRWVRAGHRVTVITCVPNVPDGVVYNGYRNRLRWQRETIDGIEVVRVWTLLAANSGFILRIINYLSYLFSATLAGLFLPRPDVVIATSPQFFCGWAGAIVHWLRRRPFVLEIRDIWPESITAVGAMHRGFVIRSLEWLERRLYLSADHIVTVGKGYRQNVAGKADVGDHITVIYNGVDGENFTPSGRDDDFLRSCGFAGRFVCSYVGTIGMAHGLETVLDAADALKHENRTDIGFLLVGDGARRRHLEEECQDRGLTDIVRFTGRLDKSQIPGVIASSDSLLVHLRACDLFETVIPSKIFEAMAMERPIIMGVRGESAEIVTRAGAGIDMEPGDADSLRNCVLALKDQSDLYRRLAQSGRQFVLREFSRDSLAAQYEQLLRSIVDSRDVGQVAPVQVQR
jgi:glycosyltransferase involved in cell wall biosynthesis